ncbi:MAG: 7-carboxy-7-deazaguanine synthase QueE [Gammaproteobacteria bacterium]|nr:7-carboxy-7-deazaguanine synthase QueE [Gammaproteobacteria bacterium]NND54368.1 7-carboxy-7-deazaguanine synthase QueE [Gammaproteobacteria bacterium]
MTEIATRDELDAGQRLRVTEIFYSVQGESRPTGLPTVFVRLTGCPLRCVFCDTAYAFHGGSWMTGEAILEQVQSYTTPQVCVTGGEPLAQPNCRVLLTLLADAGLSVSLETSGALDISELDPRVCVVMDVKTPGSGEVDKNRLENLPLLRPDDQVKFVICDRADYEWSKAFCAEHAMLERCNILFSPSQGQLEARELAEWILEDRLQVRFQVQLHKYLWGEEPGH